MGAIWFLLRYLRTNSMYLFVAYRLVLAALVVLWVLGLPSK
jgi:undecaprenyl pyrophosphate phosphatase UppP